MQIVRAIGKIIPQANHIRVSYRIRGRVARMAINIILIRDINTILIINLLLGVPGKINNITVRVDITKMPKYSDIKITANLPPKYSVLKPDTSSDSPSAMSNGVRWVSATQVINQMGIINGNAIINENPLELTNSRFNDLRGSNRAIRINAILTSYEIVCARPRVIPIDAYFELDLQLIPNIA